jgi:hypothetical protein
VGQAVEFYADSFASITCGTCGVTWSRTAFGSDLRIRYAVASLNCLVAVNN